MYQLLEAPCFLWQKIDDISEGLEKSLMKGVLTEVCRVKGTKKGGEASVESLKGQKERGELPSESLS